MSVEELQIAVAQLPAEDLNRFSEWIVGAGLKPAA